MKTLTMLFAGVTVACVVPATVQVAPVRVLAEQAHARAAGLAGATAPYSGYDRCWARVSQQAVQADGAAEAVIAALACRDVCAARQAADRLHALAEDIRDDAEDLEFCGNPVVGPCRDTVCTVERLADRFEDVTSDLRRAVRRLDSAGGYGPAVGRPICGTVVPGSTFPPCAGPQPPCSVPQNVVPGATGGYLGQPAPQEIISPAAGGSFGPSVIVPPGDSFGPAPAVPPAGAIYRGGGPSLGVPVSNGVPGMYAAHRRHHDPSAGAVLMIR